MFTSMTAKVSTNTYCLARTRRFSRRSENSVGRVTHEREVPTDTVQLVNYLERSQPIIKYVTVSLAVPHHKSTKTAKKRPTTTHA